LDEIGAAAENRAGQEGPASPWLQWWQDQGISADLPGLNLSPGELESLQRDYVERVSNLWNDFLQDPVRAATPLSDSRFSDASWQDSAVAAFQARAYLLNAEFLNRLAGALEAAPKIKARLRFSIEQWLDAMSPSNFLAFNPRAQKRLLQTRGESLAAGLHNLLEDVSKGRVTQVDESAFEVGRNVATTPGAVVFENELIQLIQYRAATPTVRERPLLIVPPCINKFYILDLQPENSFIRYAVEQGNTVFVVSWRNPGEAQATLGWDDYVRLGPFAALEATRRICGVERVNALGFCVGGTLLSTALAVLRARGEEPVESLTLLTSLLDFSETGILDIFIDEAHVQMRERTLGCGGLMPGRDLANTFSLLRANDLVWNYVVNNYLEGKPAPAFDLLYWNADSTNLPGPMYTWYLRNTYLENGLKTPGRVHCCGEAVDLGRIDRPCYVFAAREDHIVPWRSAFASMQTLSGVAAEQKRFVLGASGHIAGTINSARKNKRSYWAQDGGQPPDPDGAAAGAGPDAWLKRASEHKGSWWPDWDRWLQQFAGEMRPAPAACGNADYPATEEAPGRYVKERAA
jgi:polyhydroxyalkanoate synthase subunit PhaC